MPLFYGIAVTLVSLLVEEVHSLDLCDGNSSLVPRYLAAGPAPQRCDCEGSACVRKCCKPGYSLSRRYCVRNNSTGPFRVPLHVEKTVPVREQSPELKFLVGYLECDFFLLNNSDPEEAAYLQVDGELWVPLYNMFYGNDRYCLDEMDGASVFLCFPEEDRLGREFNVVGMLISMPFLLVTFIVYAILPESNLHRKALMFYVLSLLFAYIFLVTVQLHDGKFSDGICHTLGYLVIFFFLASFFWMNVMCIDMWLAFSGVRGFTGQRSAERKRFIFYCLYAWGVPVLHILLVLILNTYVDNKKSFYPGIGQVKCFLNDGIPNLLYFYGPMAVITLINIVLFILTAVKIQKVKKETSMLKHSDSKRHSYEADKQKFNLYLKLLFAMGINWSMEIISWAIIWKMGTSVPHYIWYLTDFCNAMYGVFIFFIFVFKKKIWRSLKKRYFVFIGKPHLANSLTTTQTTRSSNFSTTDSAPNDHRLSELKNGREERPLTQN